MNGQAPARMVRRGSLQEPQGVAARAHTRAVVELSDQAAATVGARRARSSLDEIEAILDLVVGLTYFRREELAKIEAVRDECAKTVYGLLRKMSES